MAERWMRANRSGFPEQQLSGADVQRDVVVGAGAPVDVAPVDHDDTVGLPYGDTR
jgi:hypothetical protein